MAPVWDFVVHPTTSGSSDEVDLNPGVRHCSDAYNAVVECITYMDRLGKGYDDTGFTLQGQLGNRRGVEVLVSIVTDLNIKCAHLSRGDQTGM